MLNFTLNRSHSNDKGTLGYITLNNLFLCYTLELPWENNKQNISCIPIGEYECLIWNSPKFGMTYELMNVPNRSKILIHKGNWITDINGCILVGMQQSLFDNNKGDRYSVFKSSIAFNRLKEIIGKDLSFKLDIKQIS